jgi:hypothetical protein
MGSGGSDTIRNYMKHTKSWTYLLSLNLKDFSGPDVCNDYHLIVFLKKPSEPFSPAIDQFENPERDGKMRLRKILPAYFGGHNLKLTTQNRNVWRQKLREVRVRI